MEIWWEKGPKGWMRNNHSVIKFLSSHLLVQSGSMSRCLACLLPLGWNICSCSRPTDKYTNEWRKCLFFLHTNGIHLATLESSTYNISFRGHPKMRNYASENYASVSSSSCWWWWWHPLRIDDLRMNFPGRCTTYMRLASTFDWNCTNDIVWSIDHLMIIWSGQHSHDIIIFIPSKKVKWLENDIIYFHDVNDILTSLSST